MSEVGGYSGSYSLGGEAAEALNDSLILGLLTTGAGVPPPPMPFVGDIAPAPENGGLVARGDGTAGAEPPNEGIPRRGLGMGPGPAAKLVIPLAAAGALAGGGDVAPPAGVGTAPEAPPPGGLNSAYRGHFLFVPAERKIRLNSQIGCCMCVSECESVSQ